MTIRRPGVDQSAELNIVGELGLNATLERIVALGF